MSEENLPVKISDVVEMDYIKARNNIYNLMESTDNVLQLLVQLAEQAEHPRCFEVLATLINSKAALSKDLLSLSKERNALVEKKDDEDAVDALKAFVGSTVDLQKFLASEYAKVIEAEPTESDSDE